MWGIVRKSTLVASILALCAGGASAGESGKLVLSAERDLYGFHAQQALVYGADTVTFVRNSNFLCKPSGEVLIGEFHAALTGPRTTERDYLAELAARLPKEGDAKSSAGNLDPHATHYFIGETDVSARKDDAHAASRILVEACDATWVADHAVSVKAVTARGENTLTITPLTADGTGKPRSLTFKEARCQKKSRTHWECPITNYGLVGLEVKP